MQYISVANQKAVDQTYRMSIIIVLAFCFTPILLMMLGRFINAQDAALTNPAQLELIKKLAYGSALLFGLLVVALRRFGMAWLTRQRKRSVTAVLGHLRLLALISAALGEVVALIGFVAFMLTGDYEYCWRLAVVGLLLILYSFPRRWDWDRAVASAQA
jgi:hypothetical protein